jgi:hypothetical protein
LKAFLRRLFKRSSAGIDTLSDSERARAALRRCDSA